MKLKSMECKYSLGFVALSSVLIACGCSNNDKTKVETVETTSTTSEATTSSATPVTPDTAATDSGMNAEAARSVQPGSADYMPANEKPLDATAETTTDTPTATKTSKKNTKRKTTTDRSTSSGATRPNVDSTTEPASNTWEDGSRLRNENSTNNYDKKNATNPPEDNSL